MRQGWWHFWSTSAWRQWSADLAAWKSDKTARAILEELVAAKTDKIAEAQHFADQTRRALGWVESFSPRALPVALGEGEVGLGEVGGVTFLEERRRFGHGSWVKLNEGTVYFTSRRMVLGGGHGPSIDYAELTDASLVPNGFHLTVATRSYLLEGPAEQLDISLVAAEALARGVDPMDTALDAYRDASRNLANEKEELKWLTAELGRLAPSRPRSPAWFPAGVIGLALVGFFAVSQLFGAPADTPPESLVRGSLYELATATAVIDAEMISVRFPDGKEERVRLIGIDAPTGAAPRADEATEFLTDLVAGKEVWLVADTANRDSDGSLLRYVYIADGTEFVNMTMVESGFAIAEADTGFAADLAASSGD